jgi:hypothetical protein
MCLMLVYGMVEVDPYYKFTESAFKAAVAMLPLTLL